MTQLAPKKPATPTQILVRGLAVGFVATQVLDIVSMFLYENLSDEDRVEEDRVRGGHQAYEVMVMNFAKAASVQLSEDEIKYWGWKFHRSFGVSGGVQYMALREKFPAIGASFGLVYGLGFFAIADELMIYMTKSTPGPLKFNWKAHVRGAIAHIAYGVASELTARSFDKISEYENGVGWALEEDKGNPKLQAQAKSQARTQVTSTTSGRRRGQSAGPFDDYAG